MIFSCSLPPSGFFPASGGRVAEAGDVANLFGGRIAEGSGKIISTGSRGREVLYVEKAVWNGGGMDIRNKYCKSCNELYYE